MAKVRMDGKTIVISSGYKVSLFGKDVIVLKKDGYKVAVEKDESNNVVVKDVVKSMNVFLRSNFYDSDGSTRTINSYTYKSNTDYDTFCNNVKTFYTNYGVPADLTQKYSGGWKKESLTLPTKEEFIDSLNKDVKNLNIDFKYSNVGIATIKVTKYKDGTQSGTTYTTTIAGGTSVSISDYAPSESGYDISKVTVNGVNKNRTDTFTAIKDTTYEIKVYYVTPTPSTTEQMVITFTKNSSGTGFDWTVVADSYERSGSSNGFTLQNVSSIYTSIVANDSTKAKIENSRESDNTPTFVGNLSVTNFAMTIAPKHAASPELLYFTATKK